MAAWVPSGSAPTGCSAGRWRSSGSGRPPGAGTTDFERAEREARLAARLNHPHVVAVFDLIEEGEEHWLVMEYVEGRTLSELVREDGGPHPGRGRTTAAPGRGRAGRRS